MKYCIILLFHEKRTVLYNQSTSLEKKPIGEIIHFVSFGRFCLDSFHQWYKSNSQKKLCFSPFFQNDEGAPLLCLSDSTATWELQGILSYHDNCGKTNHPAIYTAISSKIKSWVTNTIGNQAVHRQSSAVWLDRSLESRLELNVFRVLVESYRGIVERNVIYVERLCGYVYYVDRRMYNISWMCCTYDISILLWVFQLQRLCRHKFCIFGFVITFAKIALKIVL